MSRSSYRRDMTNNLKAGLLSIDDIQKKILKLLIKEDETNPSGFGMHRSVMQKTLKVSEKIMDFKMAYLEWKGLVKIIEAPNYHWLWVKVTTAGKYAIQNPKYVGLAEQLPDTFQLANNLVESKKLSRKNKSEIIEKLNMLETELAKKEPSAGSIQNIWKWLKKNAIWLLPVLYEKTFEGLKQTLLIG